MTNPKLAWNPPPAAIQLASGEVHVWAAILDLPPDRIEPLRGCLAGDELERARRFHFEVHRNRYIAGRSFLRSILARYLSVPAGQIRFRYGPKGKPYLELSPAAEDLNFNMAHSSELALYAVTRLAEVGVDVEAIRPMKDLEQIAKRFFSPAEHTDLLNLPPRDRQRGFFSCWSRKEAYLKARGTGISEGLNRFAVTLEPDAAARFREIDGNAAEAERWHLESLTPAEGYVGALALRVPNPSVRRWQWMDLR
jgi:4'-phosphopantetheinyl transferase